MKIRRKLQRRLAASASRPLLSARYFRRVWPDWGVVCWPLGEPMASVVLYPPNPQAPILF